MLLLAVAINALCVAVVLIHSARRDLTEQPIGAGGWALITVLLGPVTLVLYLAVAGRAPRV